jgi:hypothetical protein
LGGSDHVTGDDAEVSRLAVSLRRGDQHATHPGVDNELLARRVGKRGKPYAGIRHLLDHRLGHLRAHHAAA